MLVNGPQLVAPRTHWGYSRYGGTWERDSNYVLPNGQKALINGLIAEIPAGTDIAPHSDRLGSLVDINCQSVARYTPPSAIDYYLAADGTLSPAKVQTRCVTDAKLYDMGGGLIDLFGAYSPRMHCGSFSYLMCFVEGGTHLNTSPATIHVDYKSPRGGFLELVEYEQGGDGIVTVEILSGNPYAVKALRLSDSTTQVMAACGIILPAGAGQLKIRITWGSGLPATQLVCKFKYSIEVPYGI